MCVILYEKHKGSRCSALNQYYIYINSDKLFNIVLEELKVDGNICDIMDKYFEYDNKQKKIFENEYDSRFGE